MTDKYSTLKICFYIFAGVKDIRDSTIKEVQYNEYGHNLKSSNHYMLVLQKFFSVSR